MKRLLLAVTSLMLAGLFALVYAQQRKSPHEQTSATIDGKKITITYGRPYVKGRKIMGGVVPYGAVWRTGADEATTLTTATDLTINGLKVPKGTYALFTLPTQNGWKLIVNKTAKQWGAFKYDQAQDLGRVDMNVSRTARPVEQFTITITPEGQRQGVIKMEWENTTASVPFSVGG